MVRFQLFGIPITILPWFWVTLVIFGFLFTRDVSDSRGLFKVVLFVIAGFFSILIHELGHALTIKKFKARTEIVLQAFGGYATYPRNRFSRTQDFFITAAGPALQLACGYLVAYLVRGYQFPNTESAHFVGAFITVSIFWAYFNLVPIYPLDGGQMLNALLGPKRRKITHITGIVFAATLAIFGLMNGMFFLAIFMGLFAQQNYQLLKGQSPQSPF